jgi:hypothetical protein
MVTNGLSKAPVGRVAHILEVLTVAGQSAGRQLMNHYADVSGQWACCCEGEGGGPGGGGEEQHNVATSDALNRVPTQLSAGRTLASEHSPLPSFNHAHIYSLRRLQTAHIPCIFLPHQLSD